MASVINTNMASLYAQKNLSGAQSNLSTSVERLSSGLRINRAKDDAAGLGISQKINSQVVSLNQGVRNANEAISMVQTAEGSLSEVSTILQRMKELSVQARNDSLSTVQRAYISNELVSLKKEINSIAERTTFNDLSLLKNGLRTTVGGNSAQSGELAVGAALIKNVAISNVTLKNTNAGTYSITSSTKSVIGSYATGSQSVAESTTTSSGVINLITSSGTISSTVSNANTGFTASVRTIDLASLEALVLSGQQAKLDENVKVTLTINGNDFTAYVGSTMSESEGAVATALNNVLKSYHYPSSSAAATGIISLSSATLGLAEISVKAETITRGDQVQNISSSVNPPSASSVGATRIITIADNDVIAGREFVLKIGNPDAVQTYSVIVGTGESKSDVAAKLEGLMDRNYAAARAAGGSVVSLGVADLTGMATIDLSVYESKTTKVLYSEDGSKGQDSTVKTVISAKSGTVCDRTVTLSSADMVTGNTISLSIAGKQYAVTVGEDGVSSNSQVAYALTSQIQKDYQFTASTGAVTNWVTSSLGVITVGSQAELGLADISLQVTKLSDVGKLNIVANADTGIGGTSQSIDVGAVAAGTSKTYDFDKLGVSFTIANNSGSELNATDFKALDALVKKLTVKSTMDGEALFQVGAGTRDNVILTGFKDIRITGYNRNTGAEKTVFDNMSATLDIISANTTESLSNANFATLENQIEDAITTVSSFRSSFGAQQNRIEFAIANLQAQSENLTAANSRIRDTDYAAETANLTKTQIMQQAATAMLAQANQMPNVILALLK